MFDTKSIVLKQTKIINILADGFQDNLFCVKWHLLCKGCVHEITYIFFLCDTRNGHCNYRQGYFAAMLLLLNAALSKQTDFSIVSILI